MQQLLRVGVGCLLALSTATAEAAPKKGKAPRAPAGAPARPATPLGEALASPDEGKAIAALHQVGSDGGRGATDALLDAFSVGLPPKVAEAGLQALGKLKDPRTQPVLLQYASNRNPELRRAALQAVAAFKAPWADGALRAALGDPEPPVRALACKLVARRGDRVANERLLKLLRRGDEPAAEALGMLATPKAARELAELAGSVPDGLLASALAEVVKREDVADPLRVEMLKVLGKLPGEAATAALVEYLAQAGAKPRPSRDVAQRLLDERGGK